MKCSCDCNAETALLSCAEELPPDQHPDDMPVRTRPPVPVLRVACFRHGESAANAGDATDDPASIPLTERGKQQVIAIARRVAFPPNWTGPR